MTKVGVIIGRFQVAQPHAGHRYLYNEVEKLSDRIIIIVGDSRVKFTNRNPYPLHLIMKAVKEQFPEAAILSMPDHPSDEAWSKDIDDLLETVISETDEVELYGGRDSFVDRYTGKFFTKLIDSELDVSSTRIRHLHANNKAFLSKKQFSEEFALGINYACQNRFPVAYPTVDIAVIRKVLNGKYILLGRKWDRWALPGGFVDPSDNSMESAAWRELREEVVNMDTHEIAYVGSEKINDWRYRGTSDGIMTTLFMTYFLSGEPKAGDDLEEVKWFTIKDAVEKIVPEHKGLLEKVIKLI